MTGMAQLRIYCEAYLNSQLEPSRIPLMQRLAWQLDGRVPEAAAELLERREAVFGIRRKQGKDAKREAVEALLEAWHKLAEAMGMTMPEDVAEQMALEPAA